MGEIVKLVRPGISQETIDLFKKLAAAAERGDIDGAIVSCTYPGPDHDFALYVSGEARRNPVYTRGLLCQLDSELAKLTK